MVKSVYLHDLITDNFAEIPPDMTPRSIGRAKDCDIVLSPTFTCISRLQIAVQYFPYGDILLTQKSSNCDTFYGPSEEDLDNLYYNQSENILPGYLIRFKGGYDLKLLSFKDKLVQERLQSRNEDTEIINLS
ncbi:MAG TPA: hypothetical protein QGG70_03050 [Candidatus Pacearchaeota archaeon]|jgi:hypothetical protein|nr:hypothetical protein [Candidatus Pacearchaeota archaeon]